MPPDRIPDAALEPDRTGPITAIRPRWMALPSERGAPPASRSVAAPSVVLAGWLAIWLAVGTAIGMDIQHSEVVQPAVANIVERVSYRSERVTTTAATTTHAMKKTIPGSRTPKTTHVMVSAGSYVP